MKTPGITPTPVPPVYGQPPASRIQTKRIEDTLVTSETLPGEESCFTTLWNCITSFFAWLFCCKTELTAEEKVFKKSCIDPIIQKVDQYEGFKSFKIGTVINNSTPQSISGHYEAIIAFSDNKGDLPEIIEKELLAFFEKQGPDASFTLTCWITIRSDSKEEYCPLLHYYESVEYSPEA